MVCMNNHRTEHKHASRTPRGVERVPAPGQSQHSSVNQLERSRGRRWKTRWENTSFPKNFILVRSYCHKYIKTKGTRRVRTKRLHQSESGNVSCKKKSRWQQTHSETILRAMDNGLKVDHVSFWSVHVSQYNHSSGPLGHTGVK